MSPYLTSQQFLRTAAVAFVTLAAALAVIQSRRGEVTSVPAPVGRGDADLPVGELAHCRTITSDDSAGLDACRRIWAENRQRFFVPTGSLRFPAPNAPPVHVKGQERVPAHEVDQGRAR